MNDFGLQAAHECEIGLGTAEQAAAVARMRLACALDFLGARIGKEMDLKGNCGSMSGRGAKNEEAARATLVSISRSGALFEIRSSGRRRAWKRKMCVSLGSLVTGEVTVECGGDSLSDLFDGEEVAYARRGARLDEEPRAPRKSGSGLAGR